MSPSHVELNLRALDSSHLRILAALEPAGDERGAKAVSAADLAEQLHTTVGALATRLAVLLAAGFATSSVAGGRRGWLIEPAGREALATARSVKAGYGDFSDAALRRHLAGIDVP